MSVPWTARRCNRSILKEISPGCSLEGLMLKLKLQYFGHLIRGTDSLEKTLMLGKTEGRRRGRQRMRWLDGITDSTDMNPSKLWEILKDRRAWRASPWRHQELNTTERLNKNEASSRARHVPAPRAGVGSGHTRGQPGKDRRGSSPEGRGSAPGTNWTKQAQETFQNTNRYVRGAPRNPLELGLRDDIAQKENKLREAHAQTRKGTERTI